MCVRCLPLIVSHFVLSLIIPFNFWSGGRTKITTMTAKVVNHPQILTTLLVWSHLTQKWSPPWPHWHGLTLPLPSVLTHSPQLKWAAIIAYKTLFQSVNMVYVNDILQGIRHTAILIWIQHIRLTHIATQYYRWGVDHELSSFQYQKQTM